jgi:lysophospholipase L1-like esterase
MHDRRDFVFSSAAISASVLAAIDEAFADELHDLPIRPAPIQSGNTILFQGDSITDAGRQRNLGQEVNSFEAMGDGYAWLVAGQLLANARDDNLKFFNRGISGNKVYQLAERWQADCLDLRPDVVSILIGVNDVWHMLEGQHDGTLKKYETDYQALVARTKEALPQVKLIVCEPFVLNVGEVNDSWFPIFDAYRGAARRIADTAGAIFVPFQALFDRATMLMPPEHWGADGVHPTGYGSALMAHAWLRAVGA